MYFDKEAKNWDTEDKIQLAKIGSDEIQVMLGLTKFKNVLEFGCGSGLISFNLKENFDNITLLDSSEGMVSVLNEKIEAFKVNNMESVLIDLINDPPLMKKYDLIYSSLSLHHVIETEKILSVLHELLNDDGVICIVELNKEDGSFHRHIPNYDGHNGFDQSKFTKQFYDAGFTNVETRIFYQGERFVVDKDVKYSLFSLKAYK